MTEEEKHRHHNFFQKGMHKGTDKAQLSGQIYTDSLNGRVVYNEDGSFAWENAKGTKQVLTIAVNHANPLVPYPPVPGGATPPYIIIGQCLVNGQCVVLLTNNWWSEIGVISQPQFGVLLYSTVYNDFNDPAGPIPVGPNAGQGRLQLKTAWNAKMIGIVENMHTTRVYWDDDFNESRTINIIPPDGTVWSTLPYPVWHSAHAIASMPDLTWGLVKYQQDISGTLVAGKRQYAYRYISQSGYSSPWSALTAHIQCTAQDRSSLDWNQYFMSEAGSPTTKGHQFEINNLDQRFQQIEVAALYWATDLAPQGGNIFAKADIPQTGPASVIIQHTIDTGVLITAELLNQVYYEIKNAKTEAITGDNFLHKGNIELYPEPQLASTDGITAIPILKKMISDETGLVNQIPLTNQQTKTDTTTRNMFSGASGNYTEDYNIVNDYINYKGTQWEHLYKSRFRQDTYPFALVIFDRKGQKSWAQHLTDFTFPSQFGNEWTDARLSGTTTGTTGAVGDYRLTNNSPGSTDLILNHTTQGDNICPVIQGIVFDNIDLTDILFDENGDLQISGFAIVQMPRLGQVVGQGLLMNCTKNLDDSGADTKGTRPLPTAYNWYEQVGTGTYSWIGTLENGEPIEVRENAFTFECPDSFFNNNIFGTSLSADTIMPVGLVAPYNLRTGDFSYTNGGNYPYIEGGIPHTGILSPTNADQMAWCAGYATNPSPPGAAITVNFDSRTYHDVYVHTNYYWHYYNKHYLSPLNDEVDSYPHFNAPGQVDNNAGLGLAWTINKLYVDARNVPSYESSNGFSYNEICSQQGYYPVPQQFGQDLLFSKDFTARAHLNTMLLVSDTPAPTIDPYPLPAATPYGLRTASLRMRNPANPTNPQEVCHTIYYLANYMRTVGAYNITKSLLDNRVYNNIGHFIPINANTVALAKDSSSGTDKYIFNGVEVFYGDTYVDFFCYDRLEPVYFHDQPVDATPACNVTWEGYTDYAVGTAFCVESVYNHTMRAGITYPRYGSEPMNSFCNPNIASTNPNGIWYYTDTLKQSEDFLIAAVCNAANTANQYNSLQSCFGQVNTDFSLMEIYSNQKVYGECYDSFRQFLTTNFQFAQGQYGEITEMAYMGGYNSIYMLQRYAFSRILFNERAEVAATGGAITTATAGGYQGHNYISIKDGCQHQWSVVNTGKALYWCDAESGNLNRFAQNGVESYSDVHDYHDNITNWSKDYWEVVDPTGVLTHGVKRYYDNPTYLGGIHAIFDYDNESVYTTFTQRLQSSGDTIITVGTPQTVEFSQKLDQFQGRHDFHPTIYLNLKQSFFAPSPTPSAGHTPVIHQMDEGIRGQIFGVNFPSTLEFASNPSISEPKAFDVGRVLVDTQLGANRISLVNLATTIVSTQSVVLNNPASDNRPVYREGYLTYPMMQRLGRKDRVRGAYLTQKYTIDNDGSDTIVRITEVETIYRFSDKL